MSESIRVSNLFASEDYQKVFQAYSMIDYTAYDFQTLKQALVNYIQTYYPEDFNDYIESSEFIAIIELIAYLGTSLAFRVDLNSQENFIDTAQRRESIIRLAQMVNYVPQRNIPASGLFKIASLQTNQPLVDANGDAINNLAIYWNDPNNPDWFDQFIQIANAAFNSQNSFGRPSKSGVIGSIPTDLYELNSVTMLNITYPITITINGQQYPVDVCNPDFTNGLTIFERNPDPTNSFNFIYRNDSLGVGSANTGFFLYFKQGTLFNTDTNFDFPVPNRLFQIDVPNINQQDVYVQQTDQNGLVLAQWQQVPQLAGENIIYNSIQYTQRNIFDVLSGANDTITVRFADGNFGNVPTGLFRVWTRISANENLVIRPDNAQGMQISIPYYGYDGQQYTLVVTFNLEQTIGNAAASETNDQIKLRAPEVFSTQSRMVNNSDYNVLPLVYGNQIAKLQAFNRTFSGQSRYIDINDPTGFHRDLIIFGQDGTLYRDDKNLLQTVVETSTNSTNIENILINAIQTQLEDNNLAAFFQDEYLTQFENKIRVNVGNPSPAGYSLLDLSNPNTPPLYWITSPATFKNTTGFFGHTQSSSATPVILVNSFPNDNLPGNVFEPYGFIQTGSTVEFSNPLDPTTLNPAAVQSVVQDGQPIIINVTNPYANVGPVVLSVTEQNFYQATKVYPTFRTALNSTEIANVTTAITNGISFYMYYDLLSDTWSTSIAATPGITDQSSQAFVYPLPFNDPATSGIITNSGWSLTTTGSGYTDGTYPNVSVLGGSGNGAIFNFVVSGGVVTNISYVAGGTGYTIGDILTVSNIHLGGAGSGFSATVTAVSNTSEIYSNWALNSAGGLLYVQITTNHALNTTTYNITTRGRVFVFESLKDVRFYWEPGQVIIDNASGLALQDTIEIMPLVNTNETVDNNNPVIVNPTTSYLRQPIYFNISGIFIQDDGYQDPSKVQVSLVDSNGDGVPDDPNAISEIFTTTDRVVFELYTDGISGYEYSRPWYSRWSESLVSVTTPLYVYFPVNPNDTTSLYSAPFISTISTENPVAPGVNAVYLDKFDLIFLNNSNQLALTAMTPTTVTIANQVTAFFNDNASTLGFTWITGTNTVINKSSIIETYFLSKSFLIDPVSNGPGFGVYDTMQFGTSSDIITYPTGVTVISVSDAYHFDKNGKSFTQNLTYPTNQLIPFYFKWNHYSPIDQRIDPSPSNIIDMIVITDSYYQDILNWKNSNGTAATLPATPTTESLRIQFQDLDQYKMVSDYIVWNSGEFLVLFGPQAALELQATFLVVKAPTTTASDNEVKTQVVTAIDTYFDIRNWDFGETFYYTELSAFIHQQLSTMISSVVIVPSNSNSNFGSLFEIISAPNQVFISTATVSNINIVPNLSASNLRV